MFNPVLIGLGVPPTVAASTGMYMVLFSAGLNTVTLWLYDNLPLNYACWIGLWSSLGIALFLFIVGNIIKKYQRQSIIVFMLGSIILLSAIMVPIVNINHLINQKRNGFDIWAFG